MRTLKIKIFLSYLSLLAIVAIGTWFVFNEVQAYRSDESKAIGGTQVIAEVNTLLTQLYHAEGYLRSNRHSNYQQRFASYKSKIDSVVIRIDSLYTIVENPILKSDLDSIKQLLRIKQSNQWELLNMQMPNSIDSLYTHAIQKLDNKNDSLAVNVEIIQNQTVYYDSTYLKHEIKEDSKGLKRLFNIKETVIDSSLQVTVSKYLQVDSIISRVDKNDSIVSLLVSIIDDIRTENRLAERRRRIKENKIVNNSLIISSQLRHLLANIENEQLTNSLKEVEDQRVHMLRARQILIIFGVLGLMAAAFFAFNILRDLTRTQKYRRDLEAAKNKVETILKNKEMMMLSLSHDLKSPINSILGFTALLEKTGGKNEQLYLKSIENSSRHIQNLVEDLLSLAKLEQGKLPLNHESFNLNCVLGDAIDSFKAEAKARGLNLVLKSEIDDATIVYSDPVRIRQIINNLVSNALKFSYRGKVEIKLKAIKKSKSSIKALLSVSDNGVGISKDDQARLFEPFNRGKIKDHQIEGTGLGLAITKRIVNLLKGEIVLKSEAGVGTTFTVTLPLPLAFENVNPSEEALSFCMLRAKAVCLVDDDETFLKMMTAVLRSSRMVVHPFSQPKEVVSNLADLKFDLLITDIQMPGMCGTDLLAAVNKGSGKQHKAIAISGMDQLSERLNGHSFDKVLQKPFLPAQLLRAIAEVLEPDSKHNDGQSRNNKRGIANLLLFAGGDAQQEQTIINEFVSNEKEHLRQLEKYISLVNVNGIANLAHKMLNLYRQINADEIVEILVVLEERDFDALSRKEYFERAEEVRQLVQYLLIQVEETHQLMT